jgi:hypothetical protein
VAAVRQQDHRWVLIGGEGPLGDLYVVVQNLG